MTAVKIDPNDRKGVGLVSGRKVILPFDFGDEVTVKSGIDGVVTGYCVRKGSVEIEVSWFANGDAKSAWFPEWRLG